MTFNILILTLACVWVLCAPIGYRFARWSNRAMGSRWTRNDRLSAIVLSMLYGPLMPLLAILIVLVYKLETSDWGNKEAGW